MKPSEAEESQPEEELKPSEAEESQPKEELKPSEAEENSSLPNLTIFELEKLWVYHIEPLLEEYLGNKIDDDDTKKKIADLKKAFTEELKA